MLAGGRELADGDLARGYFVAPTVATAPWASPLWRDEHFLPFVLVGAVDSLDEALDRANDTDYGLTAGFYGAPDEVGTFLDRIEAGVVYVNRPQGATTGAWPGYQPFGGWKGSGSTGKAIGSFYYVTQYLREQSQTVVEWSLEIVRARVARSCRGRRRPRRGQRGVQDLGAHPHDALPGGVPGPLQEGGIAEFAVHHDGAATHLRDAVAALDRGLDREVGRALPDHTPGREPAARADAQRERAAVGHVLQGTLLLDQHQQLLVGEGREEDRGGLGEAQAAALAFDELDAARPFLRHGFAKPG